MANAPPHSHTHCRLPRRGPRFSPFLAREYWEIVSWLQLFRAIRYYGTQRMHVPQQICAAHAREREYNYIVPSEYKLQIMT